MVSVTTPDLVLAIWQELNTHVLPPPRAQEFRNHPALSALCHHEPGRLRSSGADLYQQTGRLMLAEWARECTWDGGGSAALAWQAL